MEGVTSASSRLVWQAFRSRTPPPVTRVDKLPGLVNVIGDKCSRGWNWIVSPLIGTGRRRYAHNILSELLLLDCPQTNQVQP